VSSGSALANIDADLDYIINALVLAGSDLQWAHLIMLPRTALYLARLRGTGGDLAYPGLSVKGGNLFGIPVVVSAAIPGSGSPSASIIGLVDAGQILVADDNGGTVEVGRQAALQMVDDMQSPEANTLVSMFQTDSVAYKTTRFINWEKCRTGMAQYISGVTY
jgi:HK97 family phage major capsid protein